jgi:GWxTD domain-containing protein
VTQSKKSRNEKPDPAVLRDGPYTQTMTEVSVVSSMLLALVVLSNVVEAQTPPEAVADSIFKAAANGGPEAWKDAAAKIQAILPTAPNNATLNALLGGLYLRLGDEDKARSALELATQMDSTMAAAHFGLGRVHLELRKKPKDAVRHFEAALRIDSTYADVRAQLALAYQKQGKRRLARKQADLAIRHEPRLALPYRILAESYAKDNNRAASLIYFKRYLDRNPSDQETAYTFSLQLLEEKEWDQLFEVTSRLSDSRSLPLLATALIHKGEHESALAAFRDYTATLGEEEADLYEDITPVGLKREVLAYRTTIGETRKAFLNRFWMLRDPFKTSGGAMRRAEHYRRVWHARRHFGIKKFPWDRRGEIYIRYGKPFWRSTSKDLNAIVPAAAQQVQDMMASRLYGSESIDHTFVGPVYPVRHQTDAGLSLSNASVGSGELLGLQGFKPVTAGSDWSTVPWESWIYTDIANGIEISFTDEFLSGNFDYAPIPTLSEDDMTRFERRDGSPLQFISRMTELAPAALVAHVISIKPDRYDLALLEPLHFFYEALAFRGENGKTDLQINIALPIDNVAMDEDPDTTVIVERRVVLLRGATEISRSVENLGVGINDQNRDLGLLAVERVNVTTKPGEYELRVQASRRNTNRVQVYGQALDLEDFSKTDLMLSDLQIAQYVGEGDPDNPSKFARKGWDIRPAPARTFQRGEPLFVYYEIYNLTRDEFGQTRYQIGYEVETRTSEGKITIPFLAKLRRKQGEKIGFEFEQTGTEPDENDYFELDLSEAKPGNYELKMRVTDLATEQTVSKKAVFTVSR